MREDAYTRMSDAMASYLALGPSACEANLPESVSAEGIAVNAGKRCKAGEPAAWADLQQGERGVLVYGSDEANATIARYMEIVTHWHDPEREVVIVPPPIGTVDPEAPPTPTPTPPPTPAPQPRLLTTPERQRLESIWATLLQAADENDARSQMRMFLAVMCRELNPRPRSKC